MKKLLIGLVALGSISTFAIDGYANACIKAFPSAFDGSERSSCIKLKPAVKVVDSCFEAFDMAVDTKYRFLCIKRNPVVQDIYRCLETYPSAFDEKERLNCIAPIKPSVSKPPLSSSEVTKKRREFKMCTINANKMKTRTAENTMRRLCFNKFKTVISFKSCTENANEMRTSVGENTMRRLCFDQFKKSISFGECLSNAKKMRISTAENTMRRLCHDNAWL